MNTVKSMVVGWVSLISVAGVSFYYAKKNINERRKHQELLGARPSAKLDWKERVAQEEAQRTSVAKPEDGRAKAPSPHDTGTKGHVP
ncbi:hypothetical protein BV25DRAFT_1823363 [Artomyces pyxidatus]|uniref:Uncharacterized protein n=1 Tax=Artomyces pyxidatus TaxID=48021 RepID=A0ACB8T8A8_9AGAM|nr:hypothetical protein BV25DRAFT_1823363 [Artomyces pyxidatus]